MKILGISGLARSGKDTCADIIVKNYGYVKIAFADKIKRICRDLYGFSYEQLWGPSELRDMPDYRYPNDNGYLTPRLALQLCGTEFGRTCYKDIWTNDVFKTIEELKNAINDCQSVKYYPQCGIIEIEIFDFPKGVVIPDCRFLSELECIKNNGGKIIRIKKDIINKHTHKSENDASLLDDSCFDYIINNNGTLEELEEQINVILNV